MKEESVQTTTPKSHSRRKFMSQVGFIGAAALATKAVGAKTPICRDKQRPER